MTLVAPVCVVATRQQRRKEKRVRLVIGLNRTIRLMTMPRGCVSDYDNPKQLMVRESETSLGGHKRYIALTQLPRRFRIRHI